MKGNLQQIPDASTGFDKYAEYYDSALQEGLSATGEDSTYFARRRLEWLKACLNQLHFRVDSAIDYGCGTGASTPLLMQLIESNRVVGLDISVKSLSISKERFSSARVRFFLPDEYDANDRAELVFCNGVLHHVLPADRIATLSSMRRCLKMGGLLALWENNPWNPGTRYVMKRIPFDMDAVPVSALEARRLVKAVGFDIVRTDFLFFYPHALRYLRWSECLLSKLPLGGQYQLLCRKVAPCGD